MWAGAAGPPIQAGSKNQCKQGELSPSLHHQAPVLLPREPGVSQPLPCCVPLPCWEQLLLIPLNPQEMRDHFVASLFKPTASPESHHCPSTRHKGHLPVCCKAQYLQKGQLSPGSLLCCLCSTSGWRPVCIAPSYVKINLSAMQNWGGDGNPGELSPVRG